MKFKMDTETFMVDKNYFFLDLPAEYAQTNTYKKVPVCSLINFSADNEVELQNSC